MFWGFVFRPAVCLHRGFIALENKTFIIEPVPGHDNGAHYIYRVEELALTPGACGHGFNMSSVAPENHIKSPFQSFHTRVRLVRRKCCIRAFGCLSPNLWVTWWKINGSLTKDQQKTGKRTSLDKFPVGVATFYLLLKLKIEGPCRFGHGFAWSRCSIHLPLFPSIKNSICQEVKRTNPQYLMTPE